MKEAACARPWEAARALTKTNSGGTSRAGPVAYASPLCLLTPYTIQEILA